MIRQLRTMRTAEDLEDYYDLRERMLAAPVEEIQAMVAESKARRERAAVRWEGWWDGVLDEQPELKNAPRLPNPYRL